MISISELIQLQNITIKDHSTLVHLIEHIYPPAYSYLWKNEDCIFYFEKFFSLSNLKKELAEKKSEYYFVYYNARLIGILRIQFDKPLKSKPEKLGCYIHRIYLAEEAQGKGIAHALYNWVEQKAILKGNDLIWLKAMDSKVQALHFYKKQGFSKSHEAHLDFEPLYDHLRGMIVLYKFINV